MSCVAVLGGSQFPEPGTYDHFLRCIFNGCHQELLDEALVTLSRGFMMKNIVQRV